MSGFTLEALDRALDAVLRPPVTVGLLDGDAEIVDAGYRRQLILLAPADGQDGGRERRNDGNVLFSPLAARQSIDGWVIHAGSLEVARGAMGRRELEPGDQPILRDGEMVLRLT